MTRTRLENIHYRSLAEFLYEIRQFLSFSEWEARAAGAEAQQHQALLALKGLPEVQRATVVALAERLQVQHHTAGELIDRLAAKRLIFRTRSRADRREVLLHLTRRGERVLRELSLVTLRGVEFSWTEAAARARNGCTIGRRAQTDA